MTRVFWQLFGLAFSAAVGVLSVLVAHMAGARTAFAGSVGVAVFLLFASGMHVFFAENGEAGEPQMRHPYTVAERQILGEEYVPVLARRPLDVFLGEDEATAVYGGGIFSDRPAARHRAGVR